MGGGSGLKKKETRGMDRIRWEPPLSNILVAEEGGMKGGTPGASAPGVTVVAGEKKAYALAHQGAIYNRRVPVSGWGVSGEKNPIPSIEMGYVKTRGGREKEEARG